MLRDLLIEIWWRIGKAADEARCAWDSGDRAKALVAERLKRRLEAMHRNLIRLDEEEKGAAS